MDGCGWEGIWDGRGRSAAKGWRRERRGEGQGTEGGREGWVRISARSFAWPDMSWDEAVVEDVQDTNKSGDR